MIEPGGLDQVGQLGHDLAVAERGVDDQARLVGPDAADGAGEARAGHGEIGRGVVHNAVGEADRAAVGVGHGIAAVGPLGHARQPAAAVVGHRVLDGGQMHGDGRREYAVPSASTEYWIVMSPVVVLGRMASI